ncbi:MoxR family ATPase [Brevibacterium sp. 50QC2O2]|jgi:MoxR-like ATPase|uniref:AAA family ATPase n=1 Tax=Brevibacterium TaxID=1696 RepID=UPI00211CE781|nr:MULTISPECIES: MoxR family ATPase [unclassified Brevibacterium]MCQ9384179.1 MoxR family ATPase [Brevibacterium sp. 68QC2CO]MCQ9388343.1 MoxR family ATPase [Brevibacterium sp. 50QC2O2]
MSADPNTTVDTAGLTDLARGIRTRMAQVVTGKDRAVTLSVIALFAGGHLLLEDVPGVGKTLVAKALGRSVGGTVRRIQFTPDLLPSDVLGVNLFNQETRHFEFRPGAVFSNIVIADEINRASPKTQSAMLECMAEGQASIDGTTYLMPDPFMVVATQNPIDMEGTYALPEAQRDRFMIRTSMGYPDAQEEVEMLGGGSAHRALDSLAPVAALDDLVAAREAVRLLHTSPALRGYVVSLLAATRRGGDVLLGASPRAGQQLLHAAQAHAVLAGRDFVTPDDVQSLAEPVLAHRLVMRSRDARAASEFVSHLVATVPVEG